MAIQSIVIKAKVEIENLGEHHMGCSSIHFTLDRKFRGVNKFYSTNGEAQFDDKLPYLIIHDALVILIFDFNAKEVYNVESANPVFILSAKISNGILTVKTNDYKSGENKTFVMDVKKEKLPVGYGKVSNGKMPSTYLRK